MSAPSFLAEVLRVAEEHPEALAVVAHDGSLTYAELLGKSRAFAYELEARGVARDAVVALAVTRSLSLPVAVLGTLLASAAYLPLDLSYPASRLEFMLGDSHARLVVAEKGLPLPFSFDGDLFTLDPNTLVRDGDYRPRAANPEDLAYVIYTSGSTGTPKGVAMVHGPLDELVAYQKVESGLGLGARTLQFSPLGFDVHFQELFSTWATAGTLVLIAEEERLDPNRLVDRLSKERVERLFLPFVALQALAETSVLAKKIPTHLRLVVTAGEQLQATPLLREFFGSLPNARLFNHYGPSETHVVTALALDADPSSWEALPAIGSALPHVECAVVVDGKRVARGDVGELYLGGRCLARGYLHRDELTAERFVDFEGARFYRTGDLVSESEGSIYRFQGRADGQVKVRGFRIELLEIEAALLAVPGVSQAAVRVEEPRPSDKRLVAWIAFRGEPDVESVRRKLSSELPEYMVPSRFVVMKELPRTPSGKIDKRSLPSPDRTRPSLGVRFTAPKSVLETKVVTLFEEILDLEGLGIDDHFFELGGNSLLALRFVARLAALEGTTLSAARFFAEPTARAVVKNISGEADSKLGSERAFRPSAEPVPIAVIGMAGRFPGAASIDELWANLEAGRESITRFSGPSDRVNARGIVADSLSFDARYFGINPAEADVLDPQQRLLLELSVGALENAGYATTGLPVVGVFAGTHNNSYRERYVARSPKAVERIGEFQAMLGSEKDYVATRIAHRLDLEGPALSIHTACSTSLVAIVNAVTSLRVGQCDMALAGGASLSFPSEIGHVYSEGAMLSKDGSTRPFSDDASGTVFSDGAAMIVLKRLEDAERDGDSILGVIRGVGVNNDGGKKSSFSAPSLLGQAKAIHHAQKDAGIVASDVSYVEAHGTATPVGDPIEVEALALAFRENGYVAGGDPVALGSIKGNVGHLTAAAGVTGLIKVLLALRHEKLPPSINFRAENPKIRFEDTPFAVNRRLSAWPRGSRPRIAGVSSFGVGGTNAHVVVTEAPVRIVKEEVESPRLLLLSAKTENSLRGIARSLARDLESTSENLRDVAYTLAIGRNHHSRRRAFVAASLREAREKFAAEADRALEEGKRPVTKDVVFLFPGQGSQRAGMGRGLYERSAVFRLAFDECAELAKPILGADLRKITFEDGNALEKTNVNQPAMFAVEYALGRLFESVGVTPTILVGHSLGEFVAAVFAGVFTLGEAIRLVAKRGRLMEAAEPGGMLGIRAGREIVEPLLGGALELSCDNSVSHVVVSGPNEELDRFEEELTKREIAFQRLVVKKAFHSRSMDAAAADFLGEFSDITPRNPSIPIVSSVTGELLRNEEATSRQYWANQLRRPVAFRAALDTLRRSPATLLEIGPGRALTTLAAQRTKEGALDALTGLSATGDANGEVAAFLGALAALYTRGFDLDLAALFGGEGARRVPLSGYVFDRKLHVLPIEEEDSRVAPGRATPIERGNPVMTTEKRTNRITNELRQIFEENSGIDFSTAPLEAHFVELGIDSLLVTQLATKVKSKYGVPLSFRELIEDYSTLGALANYLDGKLPPEAPSPVKSPEVAAPFARSLGTEPGVTIPQFAPVSAAPASGGELARMHKMLELQMAQLSLMSQQVALAMGAGSSSLESSMPVPVPVAVAPVASASPAAEKSAEGEEASLQKYDVKKAFGAIARIHTQTEGITKDQEARLRQFTDRYTQRTKGSKAHTQEFRSLHADPRVVSGFKPRTKELVYPIVAVRSEGARIWDIDGNEYVDALNGFGSNFFGHKNARIKAALHAQLDTGYEVGPQTMLAGESAKLVCQLTGMDRAAFCNTGSEAVMGALRIARTVTGRSLVAVFSGSYHGIFDEVIVRDTKSLRSIPAAPGILPESVKNVLVLEYGTPETLAILEARASEFAAVLVEPVQSRRPDFQPREFLHKVREITRKSGSALIFDEVITGFRARPGGAQEHFGVEADLATYGKVVGGGMPIGVIAGRNPWMDALDGGQWSFGDDSIPTAGVTYFAGTFVRHPMAMAAAHEALRILVEGGPEVQERVNRLTTDMATRLNAFFASVGVPLEIRHFSSLWKTFFTDTVAYGELLFCHLRERGVHIYDGFPCFLTMAHGEAETQFIENAYRSAVEELIQSGFLPGRLKDEAPTQLDASKPPEPGARLGRDRDGNPAWFVPNPEAPGKYIQLT